MKVIIFFLSLFSFHGFAQECSNKADFISAEYEISSNGALKENKLNNNRSSTSFELHRQGKRVLQRFSYADFSNIWRHGAHDRISLLRSFDKYQHAIEYQPNELNHKPNWQSIYQPVPVPNIKKMKLIAQTGTGCELTQQYLLKNNGSEYHLTWLPKLALVSYFQIKSNSVNKEWRLSSYQIRSERSATLFTQYDNYRSTDYADIGDNESMPFLAKMINQGFSSTQSRSPKPHRH
jgi:hypothetical protein